MNIDIYYNEVIRLKRNKFRKYCIAKEKQIKKPLPIIYEGKHIEAVLIEMRVLKHLSFLIKNAILKLDSNVSFTIVCGNKNYNFISTLVKDINRNIRIINIGKDNLTREEYSIMLLDSNFWKQFKGEKILIYQEDTIIFKKLESKFLKYDYIGAPLENREVGNGGLSLRSKSIMIKICETYYDKYKSKMENTVKLLKTHIPILKKNKIDYPRLNRFNYFYLLEKNILEDCNITDVMRYYKIGKLAPFEIANKFSVEKFAHPSPFGGHAFWYCIFKMEPWLETNLKY
jgi:hypothetical protein